MFNSIAVFLRPLLSYCLLATIIRQKKKDLEEIKKFEKNTVKRMFTLELRTTLCECVCVCGLYLRIVV